MLATLLDVEIVETSKSVSDFGVLGLKLEF